MLHAEGTDHNTDPFPEQLLRDTIPPLSPHAIPVTPASTPDQDSEDSVPTLLSSALRLGTVFSPTDNLAILHYLSPNTQPVLHSLLFGEGVMNDISAVVMLMTTTDMKKVTLGSLTSHYWGFLTMFMSSSLLGVLAGLLSALLTKCALLAICCVRNLIHEGSCLPVFPVSSFLHKPIWRHAVACSIYLNMADLSLSKTTESLNVHTSETGSLAFC